MKRNIFKMRRISVISLYTAAFFLLFASVSFLFLIIVGLCCGSFIYFSLIYWKCTTCNRRLPLKHSSTDNASCCPYCGNELGKEIDDNKLVYEKCVVLGCIIGVNVLMASVLLYDAANQRKRDIMNEQRMKVSLDSIKENYEATDERRKDAINEPISKVALDIIKKNDKVIESIGVDYKILNHAVKIHDNYLMMNIRGDRNTAIVWITIDDNNSIKKITVDLCDNDDNPIIIDIDSTELYKNMK
ncbi:hypothetical protein PV797_10240 [Clostridiaceae bacterium M8S5]|nr:hypothetical protein PV797_10240 [Clostridiaceae bacterium M8S5]